jgi:myo-inositol-hexaphosphate 3-phosphohydrolase
MVVTLEGADGAVFARAATVGAASYWAGLNTDRDPQIDATDTDDGADVVNVVTGSARA